MCVGEWTEVGVGLGVVLLSEFEGNIDELWVGVWEGDAEDLEGVEESGVVVGDAEDGELLGVGIVVASGASEYACAVLEGIGHNGDLGISCGYDVAFKKGVGK